MDVWVEPRTGHVWLEYCGEADLCVGSIDPHQAPEVIEFINKAVAYWNRVEQRIAKTLKDMEGDTE